jgi:transposase
MPGIGNVASIVIAAEIGEIERFSSPRKLCNYSGLVPGISQSGMKSYKTGITKQGSKLLRWMLIQCAQIAIRKENRFQRYFYRIKGKKHRNVAITAVARKMLYIIWFMLTNNEPYIER